MASLCGWASSSIQLSLSLNPIESMTSVSPSHLPIASPKNEGSASFMCPRPSMGIVRKVHISSYRNTTRFEFCTISKGTPLMLARGIPANRHRASGLIDFERLYLYASSPAGVNGGPPTLLNMPPKISGPFQNPDRSGLPSAVRGVGLEGPADALIPADSLPNSLYGFSGGGVDCAAADGCIHRNAARMLQATRYRMCVN